MTRNVIRTSKRIASAASRALQNAKNGKTVKSIAGDALVNRKSNSKKRG